MLPEEEPDQTTRTPEPDDGDAGESTQTTGTQAEDGRDAGQVSESERALLLDRKLLAERNKQLAEEVEALRRERIDAGHTPASSGDGGAADDEIAELEAENEELRKLEATDPLAKITRRQNERFIKQLQQLNENTANAFALAELPKEKRAPAYELFRKHPNRFRNVAEASEYLNNRDTETEVARLRKENEELRKKTVADDDEDVRTTRTKEDAVRTTGRDLSTPTHKSRTMTQTQYAKEKERLEEIGTPESMRERRDLIRSTMGAAPKVVLRKG
jgi:hypothetical protein